MISEVQAHCIEWLSAYSHFNITTLISSQKDFKINEKNKKVMIRTSIPTLTAE